jgi:hypothetical protein
MCDSSSVVWQGCAALQIGLGLEGVLQFSNKCGMETHVYSSVIWQGCAALQVGLGLQGVLPEGPLDLLVEVSIAIINGINVLVGVVSPPPAEALPLVPLGFQLHHHPVNVLLQNPLSIQHPSLLSTRLT